MTPWRLEIVDEIGSTSDALIERAGSGMDDRVALLARLQTKGRGRRGRTWQAPSGSLAMSVLVRPNSALHEVGYAVFVAGLALHEALGAALRDDRVLSLKWPNDVLLAGDKVGGILVEAASGRSGHVDWLVIGFGANLVRAPSVEGRRAACLAGPGSEPSSAEAVGTELLAGLDRWTACLQSQGFGAIREDWLRRAHPVGTALVVDGRAGRFAGLTDVGHLLFDVSGKVEVVSAGDVVLADA